MSGPAPSPDEPEECPFCLEVETAGTATSPGPDAALRRSRLLWRDGSFDVFAGLGALAPGYLVVVPHRHVLSSAALTEREGRAGWDLVTRLRTMVEQEMGVETVVTEHGTGPTSPRRQRACIEHAHIHVFPVPSGADHSAFLPPGSRSIPSRTVPHAVDPDASYHLTLLPSGETFLSTATPVPSQFARMAWAQVLGRQEEWDWAASPGWDEIHETMDRLQTRITSDRTGEKAQLDSTLRAYAAHATEYVHRTADYTARSPLRKDLDDFIAVAPPGMILDAGAGGGRDTRYIRSRGRVAVAVDAVSQLFVASSLEPPAVVADARALPFRTGSFGAIWCSAVLLHLSPRQARQTVEEFATALRSGGILHVSIKEGRGTYSAPMTGDSGSRRFFHLYDATSLEALLRIAGFRLERLWMEDDHDSGGVETCWMKAWARLP